MHELVRQQPRYGYRRIWAMLCRQGWRVNRKKVYRLWRREGFKVPRKTRKKRRLGVSSNSCLRRRAERLDHVWAWDFIHDRTTQGQPLKWLAITDEYTRECLALEVDRGIAAERMLDVLTNLFLTRGVPQHIRSDNGPEFIAKAIRTHAERVGLEMLYIEPASPWENGYAESFFSRLRDELLNCEEFANLAEAGWFARRRRQEHNHERPHSSLGYQTPAEFADATNLRSVQRHTRGKDFPRLNDRGYIEARTWGPIRSTAWVLSAVEQPRLAARNRIFTCPHTQSTGYLELPVQRVQESAPATTKWKK